MQNDMFVTTEDSADDAICLDLTLGATTLMEAECHTAVLWALSCENSLEIRSNDQI